MTSSRTVIFLGGKEIGAACFEHLLLKREDLKIHIVGVLTNRRTLFHSAKTVESIAVDAAIPVIDSLDRMVEGPDVDILISVQYHEILKPRHIAKARQIAVNLHMAPLPEYRGCNQFSFAILNGDREFGTTLHRLEEGIDSGDILAERRFPVAEDVTVQELYTATFGESVKLFEETLPQLVTGNYKLCPQSFYRTTRKSSIHYRKDIEALKRIDISASEEEIYRRIRATAMLGFAPPYALVGRHKIEFQLHNQ